MPGTADLEALVEKVDAFTRRAERDQAAWLRCAAGCDGCCHTRRTAWAVEIERLRRHLAGLDSATRARLTARRATEPVRVGARCVFLDDGGRCEIYPARPILCRTHGPAAVTPDDEVVWCALNFAALGPDEVMEQVPEESLLRLGTLDTLLALVNQRYCAARPGVPSRAALDTALDAALDA